MDFVAGLAPTLEGPVLEVGSADVNGSVRGLLPQEGYVGVDLAPGPGVDTVADAADLPFPDGSFATVVSTEMLEHALDPVACVAEMARVLRPGGRIVLTARSPGFPFHNPPDRWRFMAGTLTELLAGMGLEGALEEADPQVPGRFATAGKAGA